MTAASVGSAISASHSQIPADLSIGAGSSITAASVTVGTGVVIGPNVDITGDEVVIGDGARIGVGVSILAPEIRIGAGCSIAADVTAEFNQYLRLGAHSAIGGHVAMVGQGFASGEFLWMKDNVTIGGGGARGPRSFLSIGDHTSIFDDGYINLSESVTIGSGSALSKGVSLLTHAAWQPALMGYGTRFAPITIGDHSVVYLNASVMPGVTIGDYATLGAHSLLTDDLPDHCLAAGVPARIRRGPEGYPRSLTREQQQALVREILVDYVSTLPSKGIEVRTDGLATTDSAEVVFNGSPLTIALLTDRSAALPGRADLTLSLDPAHAERRGTYHFDLLELRYDGVQHPLAEDLRDHLRRRAVRVLTGQPFRALPPANVSRLRRARASRPGT